LQLFIFTICKSNLYINIKSLIQYCFDFKAFLMVMIKFENTSTYLTQQSIKYNQFINSKVILFQNLFH
jgi:hypothetical protein